MCDINSCWLIASTPSMVTIGSQRLRSSSSTSLTLSEWSFFSKIVRLEPRWFCECFAFEDERWLGFSESRTPLKDLLSLLGSLGSLNLDFTTVLKPLGLLTPIEYLTLKAALSVMALLLLSLYFSLRLPSSGVFSSECSPEL